MKKIKDIICSKTNYDEMYDLNNSYIGTILIENGTFQGIMVNYETKEESFIFGTIEEDGFIEIIESSPIQDEIPRAYKASFNEKNYRGDFLAKTAYYEYPIGECQISVLEPYYYRESSYGEQVKLETHIHHHINQMNSDSKELYRTVIIKNENKQKRKIKKQTTQQ